MEILRPGLPRPDAVLLRLRLIGRMQALTLDNQSVLPLGRKTRGLLAILALSGRRPVLRLRLAELLWSRRSEEQARASLRQEIHRLLEALSPLGADVITVERHTLALKPALTSVDAERILNATANQAETLPPIDGILLEELNGTDPALDVWLQTERDRLRDYAIGLFEQMLLRQRDPTGTQTAARQLLLLDPLHERAWRGMIRAQLEQGDTGLALQTAERCAAAFSARQGAEPGLETRRLLSELGHAGMISGSGTPTGMMAGAGLRSMADELPDDPSSFLPETVGAGHSNGAEPRPDHNNGAQPEHLGRQVDVTENRRRDLGGQPLLAVLPLLDLDGGVSQNGLTTGLTTGLVEAISAGLVRQGELKLLSGSELRDSLAQGRDDAVLRRSFGLDYVLDGTLQRAAGRLRVILRLTDIRQHGQLVWAQRFDATDGDALSLQDEVSAQVSARLPGEIMLVEGQRMRRRPLSELDPHGLVMRAFSCILTGDRIQSDQAGTLLSQSIQRDSENPFAYVASGLGHLLRRLQNWGDPEREVELADAATRAALDHSPLLSLAMAMRCIVRSELNDEPEAALALAERARALHPDSATSWAASAFPLVRLGRLDEAASCFARYKALFPTHPYEMLLDLPGIMIPLLQGRYEDAAGIGLTLSELRPGFAPTLVPYLSALGHLRRAGDAARVRNQLQAIWPRHDIAQLVGAAGLRGDGDRERFASGLHMAGIDDTAVALSGGSASSPGKIGAAGPLGGARWAG